MQKNAKKINFANFALKAKKAKKELQKKANAKNAQRQKMQKTKAKNGKCKKRQMQKMQKAARSEDTLSRVLFDFFPNPVNISYDIYDFYYWQKNRLTPVRKSMKFPLI